MQPMTGNIDGHGCLKEEEILWVEGAKAEQQTHGSTTVGEHVQHSTKLGAWQ